MQASLDEMLRAIPVLRRQHRPLRPAARDHRRGRPGRRPGARPPGDGAALRRHRRAAAGAARMSASDSTARPGLALNHRGGDMTRNDRHLSTEQLVAAIDDGDDRHRRRRVHRHAGPAAGQAAARRRTSVDEVLGHGTEGCNYLLGVDVDMNTVDRLRDVLVGEGLRRHGVRARPRHHPAAAAPARLRRWCSATWPGSTGAPVVPVAAHDPARPSRSRGRRAAGFVALAGTELEFILFNDTYEEAWDAGYQRPDAGQPVQRRLLDPRHHPGRAAAARHPQHHVRRRA